MHKNQQEHDFLISFGAIQTEVHKNAVEHGWWNEDKNEGECIALMHSELSEALEALRKGNPDDNHCCEFKNVEIEFADVVIRIMDNAEKRGYRLAEAILAKARYNVGREYRHGKKF